MSILAIIYGLKELARYGFGLVPVLSIVLGLTVGAVFLSRQGKLDDPLLDLKLFKIGAFTAALLILMVSMLGTGGGYLFITGFVQMVEGYSPLEAGLWMVPAAIASILAAQLAPIFAKQHPLSTVIGVSLLIGMIGYVLLIFVGPVGGMPLLITGFVITFIGVGTFGALGTNLVVGSVPRSGAAPRRHSPPSAVTWAPHSASPRSAASAPPSTAARSTCPTAHRPARPTPPRGAWRARSRPLATCRPMPPTACWPPHRTPTPHGLNAIGIACAVVTAISATFAFTLLRKSSGAVPSGGAPKEQEEKAEDSLSTT